MKNYIKNTTLIICLIFLNLLVFAQEEKIEYQYDAKGNRIKRQTVILPAQTDRNFNLTELEVEEETKEFSILISPNPTKGELKVLITGQEDYEESSLGIYTMNGALIQKIEPIKETNYLNLQNQSPGMYILRLVIGDKVETWKVVKQ